MKITIPNICGYTFLHFSLKHATLYVTVTVDCAAATCMVKISFEGRSVHLPCTEMTTGELINFFQVERPGMHLKIKRGSAYQNIWPNENGIFKVPHDVDSVILIAVKEIRNTEEEPEMVQNTPTYSAFSSTPGSAVNRYNPPTGAFITGHARRGNATATMHRCLET